MVRRVGRLVLHHILWGDQCGAGWADFGPRPLNPSVASNMLHSFGHLISTLYNIVDLTMLDDVTFVWPGLKTNFQLKNLNTSNNQTMLVQTRRKQNFKV